MNFLKKKGSKTSGPHFTDPEKAFRFLKTTAWDDEMGIAFKIKPGTKYIFIEMDPHRGDQYIQIDDQGVIARANKEYQMIKDNED